WVDANVSLPFAQGVVQVGHHSYTPTKDAGCGPPPGQTSCEPDTWHWSDFAISRSGSFGILNGDLMSAHAGAETVHFPAAAPAGARDERAPAGAVDLADGDDVCAAVPAPPGQLRRPGRAGPVRPRDAAADRPDRAARARVRRPARLPSPVQPAAPRAAQARLIP